MRKCVVPSVICLTDFFIVPPYSEARLSPTSGPHSILHLEDSPHFRVIKRHSLPIPTSPAAYTQGHQLWIAGARPQGGCTEGSVGL